MTEPTLEEKLAELSRIENARASLSISHLSTYAEIEPDSLSKAVESYHCMELATAINWLYETAKREGYLG